MFHFAGHYSILLLGCNDGTFDGNKGWYRQGADLEISIGQFEGGEQGVRRMLDFAEQE